MRELSYDSFFFFKWLSSELFHAVHGVLKAKILKWFAIPFPVDHILSWASKLLWMVAAAMKDACSWEEKL